MGNSLDQSPPFINADLARRLVGAQFPHWKDLPIEPVAMGGWDNITFHLGKDFVIRMRRGQSYALKVEKEHQWLPRLSSFLPLPIPEPVAMGDPGEGYAWKWSIYRWIPGTPAAAEPLPDLCDFATRLAHFLKALHAIDPAGGPPPGLHNFYRGGPLETYDAETRQAISLLKGKVDTDAAMRLWDTALKTNLAKPPVWIHGDISTGNLLVQNGALSAVIDFGGMGIGDPACDLAIAWTFFHGESRRLFRKLLSLDPETWDRGRAWTLWKALIVSAGFTQTNAAESTKSWHVLNEVLTDYKTSL